MSAPKTVAEANKQLNEIDFQTQLRGSNSNEYEIYVACMKGTGEYIKTFKEWMAS